MKNLIYLLLTLPLLFASCSNDEVPMSEESVEVRLSAEFPVVKSSAQDLVVNKVFCAIYENGTQVMRLEQPITSAGNIQFLPRLVKGRTYDIAFWAMKDNNYDVTNMKCITRATTGSANEADYDAFTAQRRITVLNPVSETVTLTRPLAQLNIGITDTEWATLTNTFSQTPATTTISYPDAKDAFDAVEGCAVAGSNAVVTRRANATGTITVNGVEYKNLGMCYILLAEAEETTIDLTYTVTDTNDSEIASLNIPFVPVQRNYKTNIVGNLLTGTVSVQVTLNDFENQQHNENI